MATKKRAAIYCRVSSDRQTVQNQIAELTAMAERRGWEIGDRIYSDQGISGTKGRDQRPGLDRMLNDAKKRKFDILLTWALDRLGRSLIDVVSTVEELKSDGIDLYIEKFSGDQCVDTTSPAGRLMFLIFAGIAEFERGMNIQRVHAGIGRAKAKGVKFGRPTIDPKVEEKIQAALKAGGTMRPIAKKFGVGLGSVARIAAGMAA
jgi:DNA invertase Pin-like site-specific DNA recombinase